ncbi:MAG TPA: hypothetical protein DD979_11355 [Gammaproteobacteria bacterium]|jgi:hypothetical protein|nr:hypothetical protein [Gammaproteobacteria bacterium]
MEMLKEHLLSGSKHYRHARLSLAKKDFLIAKSNAYKLLRNATISEELITYLTLTHQNLADLYTREGQTHYAESELRTLYQQLNNEIKPEKHTPDELRTLEHAASNSYKLLQDYISKNGSYLRQHLPYKSRLPKVGSVA